MRLRPFLTGRMLAAAGRRSPQKGRLAALKAAGLRVPRDQWVELPVPAFLVEHPGAGPLLVDTGFHPSVAVDPVQAFGRLGGLVFKDVRMEPGQSLPDHLRGAGIQPADVRKWS